LGKRRERTAFSANIPKCLLDSFGNQYLESGSKAGWNGEEIKREFSFITTLIDNIFKIFDTSKKKTDRD